MNRHTTTTPCAITEKDRPCREDSHALLYAVGGDFAGRTYQPGQHIPVCLRHADHILDARRGHSPHTPAWLIPHTDRLPLPKLPDQPTPQPSPRPQPWRTRPRERRPA
jgi:hypothetical protein